MNRAVQVCLAAMHTAATGAASAALAPAAAVHSVSVVAASPLVRMDAVVSQHFTEEHGSGVAAVYAGEHCHPGLQLH